MFLNWEMLATCIKCLALQKHFKKISTGLKLKCSLHEANLSEQFCIIFVMLLKFSFASFLKMICCITLHKCKDGRPLPTRDRRALQQFEERLRGLRRRGRRLEYVERSYWSRFCGAMRPLKVKTLSYFMLQRHSMNSSVPLKLIIWNAVVQIIFLIDLITPGPLMSQ